MSGNLCRCGAYRGVTEAVLEAHQTLSEAAREDAA
jgi:xanthine dehydrogenase YagT iron-sulfur-binding subunit